jgi:putative addiction module component (TIGR02574 family)
MQLTPDVILDAALHLTDSERLNLVSRLLETVPADDSALSLDDPTLADELERRFADREGSVAWPDLRAEE